MIHHGRHHDIVNICSDYIFVLGPDFGSITWVTIDPATLLREQGISVTAQAISASSAPAARLGLQGHDVAALRAGAVGASLLTAGQASR